MVSAVRVLCPAKINLDLRVGPLAADGFHPLRSWMVTVGLFDTLDISLDTTDGSAEGLRNPRGQAARLHMSCSDPSLPCDATNLVLRAANLLRDAALRMSAGVSLPNAHLHLHKRIPAGGGLGGGSSDAASTLIALNAVWQLGFSAQQLSDLAAKLGSDIPFFLHGPSSVCTGRGEIVRPITPPAARCAVLVLPEIAMPTPAVYRQFDAMRTDSDAWQQAVDDKQWAALSARDLLLRLGNDLEPPAFALRPDLADLRAAAEKSLGRPVRMSGSGSTLFSLYDTQREGDTAAKRLTEHRGVRTLCVPIAPNASEGFEHL